MSRDKSIGTTQENYRYSQDVSEACEHCGEIVDLDHYNVAWGLCSACINTNEEHRKNYADRFKKALRELNNV